MRGIQTLLISNFERVVLREFREHGLETRIEFGKFALRNLISDFARSVDLDEESENLIIIRRNFVIRYIVAWNARIDFPDEEHSSQRDKHQHDLRNKLGKQRFHGEI